MAKLIKITGELDRNIFYIDKYDLANSAKILYMYLFGLENRNSITDAELMSALNISVGSLRKYKSQLKALDLINVLRGENRHIMFMGSTSTPASKVRDYWLKKVS